MRNAVAFANNDVITIAWSYGERPDGCMGFAVYRIDDKGKETPLPSHAVFKGDQIRPGQTTVEFPVQKFYWKDVYARPIAETSGKRRFRYKIVPLSGAPHQLKPMPNLPFLVSNEVEISPSIAPHIEAFFNRGLISTQHVASAFKGKPSKTKLLPQIGDAKNPLRADLSGDMVEALTGFVDRAKRSGEIYAALYELGDEELIKKLTGLGKRLHIVLSNSVQKEKDETTGKTTEHDGNQDSRDALHKSGAEKFDRMMPSNHIGHNKFLVYVANRKPKAVLFGSTNWTPTGLCAQTNNTLIIDDEKLATRYLDYWKHLAKDTKDAAGVSKDLQAPPLREFDATAKTLSIDGASLESWFSPNTPKQRGKNMADEVPPPDMSAICKYITGAKQAILFLAFNPGTPSIANWCAQAQKKDSNLFVRGCVTNLDTAGNYYYTLKGKTPPKKVKGQKRVVPEDPRVIAAEAFTEGTPEQWQKEILNAGFAIIHDKILVIDPFSDHCVVVTGSHNLGHKASFNNDEILAIIEGNRELAVAYTTHVLDVYDHFSWRYNVNHEGRNGTDPYLKDTPDKWLDTYFAPDGSVKVAQLKFWMSATMKPEPAPHRRGRH
ncbi:MAG TPA: phospholipase D-like domain-containing protein [Thermoanaerobaculia bacterium]|nr:phospholipase D-like domain-containing protein [Thermoanaerobaculia bacterium]